jgi:polyphenol oxidase
MYRHEPDGLAYYTFESLQQFPELVHAITTRHGGVSAEPYSSLNISRGLGDDPEAVEENLRRVCSVLGLRRRDVVSPHQRHTANVRKVGPAQRGHVQVGCDALITDQAHVPLLLRYADCVPVLIYDPSHHAIALVHSGCTRRTARGSGVDDKGVRQPARRHGRRDWTKHRPLLL